MKPSKATASILSLIASGSLGVDAMVFDDTVLSAQTDIIAEERVEVRQIENLVEAKAPWKGEQGISIKYDMGEPSFTDRVKDRRKQEVIYEAVDFGDGGFKIDVLLTEKPSTNRFCYTIEGAENYDFFYQPPLTEQEKAEGSSRPPEIEGSYAVYHKTLKNHVIGQENYATGKVMHIPRPQVWELGNEEATKQWADLSYENGQLCVTAPQDFIDNADYTNGVRIDPTFGYTALGASNVGGGANSNTFHVATTTMSGDVTTIVYWVQGPAGSCKGSLNNRADYTLVTNGVGDAVAAVGTSWNVSTTTNLSITAGSAYTIGAVCSAAGVNFQFDSGAANSGGFGAQNYTTPGTISAVTLASRRHSMYAVYSSTLTITTQPATSITQYSASLNGNISDTGTTSISQHGFVYGTSASLTGGDTATSSLGSGALGDFTESIQVSPGVVYYFRAYAVNGTATTTGEISSFQAASEPRARINTGTIRINNGTLDL